MSVLVVGDWASGHPRARQVGEHMRGWLAAGES